MAKVVAAGLFTKIPILELTTSNLNGLKDNGHLVARRLRTPTQVVLFQETKLNNATHLETFHYHLNNEVGVEKYKLFTNDLRATRTDSLNNRRCGVASYFHDSTPGFSNLHHLTRFDQPGRYMVVRTDWDDVPVYFHNVYAPVIAHSRHSFFDALPRDFEDNSIHFVGGDFNLPLDEQLDASRPRPDHNAGKAECIAWLSALGVVDAWRIHNPNERTFSGPCRSNRLDYIFIDHDTLAQAYKDSKYSKNLFAGDHLEHTVILSSGERVPDRGNWRLPRELLKDPQIADAIKQDASQLLEEMSSDDSLNYGAKWYGWLKRMKKRLQQCHRHHLQFMQYELNSLKMKWLATRHANVQGLESYAAVESARSALDTARSEYRQYHLDQQFDFHANVNERGSSHFFRRPKGLKVPISSVTVDDTIVNDTATVKSVFTAHWRSIMVAAEDRPPLNRARRRAVVRAISRRLSPEQRQQLDSPLTADELSSALKTMNPNKSPGPDGWPAAFFQVAPDVFSQILLKVFEYQLEHHGKLLLQQRRSAVALLFKAGDRGNPGNYRPIALMSVEVKILSRALAYRLAQVAPHLVHPSQAGFVPGRRLHDHVMLVQALQSFCTNEDNDYYATFLDFSKAYDMVDQSFLLDVMNEMNIGPNFVSWVQLLYSSPLVQIIFNGTLGPTIRPNRGVKQGCPLSCLLFVLYLEPLGEMLRGSPHLGIPLPNGDILTSIFFADDSTLLSNSLQAAVEQLTIVEEFCSVSGARLNNAKCMTLVLNDHLDLDDIEADGLLNIVPTGQPTKYLGFLFGHRLPKDFQVQQLSDKFLAAFQLWGSRARTIQGRKLIVSTMLLPMLWHVTAAVTVPKSTINVWQQMVKKFILGRKTHITDKHRPAICQTWQYDRKLGLGIPHVASKIRTQRLLRLQHLMLPDAPDQLTPWKVLVQRQFARTVSKLHRDDHPFDFLLYYPNRSSKWLQLWELHPLWADIWRQWSSTPMSQRIGSPPSLENILNQPIWLNSYEAMQVGRARYAFNIARNPDIRRWCRNGAQNGLRSLKDFLTRQGTWPTSAVFVTRMSTNNSAARVQLDRSGSIVLATPSLALQVYMHLTRLYDHVLQSHQVRPGTAFPNVPTTSHPFTAVVKENFQPFETWPKRYVAKLAYHAPFEDKPHPMANATRKEKKDLVQYMNLVRKTCRAPPPVQGDVWFRLLMNMLSVNSRFYFMQPLQPDAVCCVYEDCNAVETLHHAFHTCSHVHPLWSYHASSWRFFGVKFDWASITNVDKFQVNSRNSVHKEALKILWTLLCASNLHSIWTQRNSVKFDSKSPLPQSVWQELSFISWHTSIRRWLRLRDSEDPDRRAILAVLEIFRNQVGYRALYNKHPSSIVLQPIPTTN